MAIPSTRLRTILGTMSFGAAANDEVVSSMLNAFSSHGHRELDTAIMYVNGESERLMGRLNVCERFQVASKANPMTLGSLSESNVIEMMNRSLASLNTSSVDLYYLHWPDHNTPILESLRAIDQLHRDGRLKEFGLSNYTSWQVAHIYHLCKEHGFILPTVYQGMYNAITREVEAELFPALNEFGIRFYAYNPLAGGMLTDRYQRGDDPTDGRFSGLTLWGSVYRQRYMKEQQFDALEQIRDACKVHSIATSDVAIRWLYHHSKLSPERGDGVILGASTVAHLQANLSAAEAGPLPEDILAAIDRANEISRPVCPHYYR